MSKKFIFIFSLFFVFFIFNVYSVEITEKEVSGFYRGVYTRSNDFVNGVSATGALELESKFLFRGGLALGSSLTSTDIETFISTGYSPFQKIPLEFSVFYIYNGLPVYKTHANSVIPLLSYNADRAGISLGCNFRFTRFFAESAQFESIISFYGYFNIINTETLCIGIGGGNLRDFHADNLGAYSLNFYGEVQLNDSWRLINDIELKQSGGDGLSTTLYGITFQTGVKYSW